MTIKPIPEQLPTPIFFEPIEVPVPESPAKNEDGIDPAVAAMTQNFARKILPRVLTRPTCSPTLTEKKSSGTENKEATQPQPLKPAVFRRPVSINYSSFGVRPVRIQANVDFKPAETILDLRKKASVDQKKASP